MDLSFKDCIIVITGNDSSQTFVCMCVKSLCSRDIIQILYCIIRSIIEPPSLKDHNIYFLSESWCVHILHTHTHCNELRTASKQPLLQTYAMLTLPPSVSLSCFEVIKHISPSLPCFFPVFLCPHIHHLPIAHLSPSSSH